MARYAYRCDTDGPVEVVRPIGTAPATVDCPSCGATASRVFTAPMLGLADRGRMGLIDRTTASAHEPQVVSAPPPRPLRRDAPAPHPATRRLPRP
ncbi:FmdB family zinc ribbon protein [Pseudonocardia nematodicida]|uniref:FmdB family zinc ribbon protein n=1 Tax=Pseudonocardia nematodicida TaxID=1206997 RepID=A0ABV1KDK8_9PSEU